MNILGLGLVNKTKGQETILEILILTYGKWPEVSLMKRINCSLEDHDCGFLCFQEHEKYARHSTVTTTDPEKCLSWLPIEAGVG